VTELVRSVTAAAVEQALRKAGLREVRLLGMLCRVETQCDCVVSGDRDG
jgi:hypothetical protein